MSLTFGVFVRRDFSERQEKARKSFGLFSLICTFVREFYACESAHARQSPSVRGVTFGRTLKPKIIISQWIPTSSKVINLGRGTVL